MAGSKTDAHETTVLNILRNTSVAAIPNLFLALFTADPLDDQSGVSVANETNSGGGYARTAITFGAPTGTSPTQVQNDIAVTFTKATTNWGTISHWGVATSSTAGAQTLLYHGDFDTAKAIDTDDTAEVPIGNLTITED